MPDVVECLKQCQWLVAHGRASEPAKLVLPRIEAKRRIENKEKHHRVQFDCDETTYSAFHAQLKRYRELVTNVTIAQQIMVELLAQVSDESIRALAEEEKPW
jgi:hypothetical protein